MVSHYIEVIAGEGILVSDPQVTRILNKYDLTFGYAKFIDMLNIKNVSSLALEFWVLIHRILALFGIEVKIPENSDNPELEYLLKLQKEIAKRFPSLLTIYNKLIIDLYVNVKYLRSREGFEREAQITRKEITKEEKESEKAEETRESIIKRKLKGEV